MICDESAQQLHDKATRGGTLSSDERAHLDAWLSAQDETEASLLSPKRVEPALAELRSQVNSSLKQVGTITRSIQQLSGRSRDRHEPAGGHPRAGPQPGDLRVRILWRNRGGHRGIADDGSLQTLDPRRKRRA
jgi:hypothetical protein